MPLLLRCSSHINHHDASLCSTLDAFVVAEGRGEGDPDGIDRAGDVPLFSSSIQMFMQARACTVCDLWQLHHLTPCLLVADQIVHQALHSA